jgi:hypothetical protein
MESVKIGRFVVVGKPIADEDSIAFLKDKIFAVNGSLVDLDSQEPW